MAEIRHIPRSASGDKCPNRGCGVRLLLQLESPLWICKFAIGTSFGMGACSIHPNSLLHAQRSLIALKEIPVISRAKCRQMGRNYRKSLILCLDWPEIRLYSADRFPCYPGIEGTIDDQIWPARLRAYRQASLRSAGRQSHRWRQPGRRLRSRSRARRRHRVEVRRAGALRHRRLSRAQGHRRGRGADAERNASRSTSSPAPGPESMSSSKSRWRCGCRTPTT